MEDDPDGSAPTPDGRVADARAQLDAARRSGQTGPIAMAHAQLATTLAMLHQHEAALPEFDALLSYLQVAKQDQNHDTQRWLRMSSPGFPPPDPTDVDLGRLEALMRLARTDSLLSLGRRQDAAAELERAAPMCRGFGRRGLKRKHRELSLRLSGTDGRMSPGPSGSSASDESVSRHPSLRGGGGPARSGLSIQERLAAADAAVAAGDHARAARTALGIVADCDDSRVAVRARARQVLGMALEGMDQEEDAWEVMAGALDDYCAAGEAGPALNLAVPLIWRLGHAGRNERAIEVARAALEGTVQVTSDDRAQVMVELASLLDQTGRHEEAGVQFHDAIEAATDDHTIANAHHGAGVCLANDPGADDEQLVDALSLLDRARRQYDDLGEGPLAAGCEHEAAALLGRLGSLNRAGARYGRAMERYRALPAEQRDATWDDEVADARHNISALSSQDVGGTSGLFASGGHQMHHR